MDALLPTLQCLRAELDTDSTVLSVQLHRPHAFNAISMEALQELHKLLDALQINPSIFTTPDTAPRIPRVVIIHGAGRAFCAGVDVKAAERGVGGTVCQCCGQPAHTAHTLHHQHQAWDYTDMRSQQLLALAVEKMRRLPQPFIACLHGVASGT